MNKSAEEHVREIRDWLSSRVRQEDARGVVLEVDGTLESSVTAALAREALGANVLCLILPCQSSRRDLEASTAVVNHLGLRHEVLDLNPFYNGFLHALPKAPAEPEAGLKSRLAMIVLQHYGAAHKYMVLGNMNRGDWEIGRYTRHGDDSADAFPLAHLLGSDLRSLARYLDIPDSILRKSPVSAMWRPREGETPGHGFSAEELDAYLTGEFKLVSKQAQRQIRDLQQAAVTKRRLPARLSSADQVGQNIESSLVTGRENYDKTIEALTLISKAITSDQYLEDILRLIVVVTAEVMNSSVCSLWLLDGKEGVLRLRATQSMDREYLKDRVLKVGEGVVGKVVEENRPLLVPNVLLDPFFKEKDLARRMGLVSMLSIPMRAGDRVIGVINCYTSRPHSFSELQMNVLTTVANQAAIAIEKTELMVQTKVIQEELERRKIIERAKDLLMNRLDLSGEEAYRWLQKRSMNTRKSMREVSEAVLLAMEG